MKNQQCGPHAPRESGSLWVAKRTTARRGCPAGPLSHTRRHGAVLVAALVCLAIIVAMIGSMLVTALAASRQLHAERDLRQCELLLQAGVDRAAYRLATERTYRGETWTLSNDNI